MSHPCPKFEPELSAWLDGELPPALATEIETHLRACAPCRAAVAQLRGVSRALRRWDAHETRYATSTGFRNRVLSTLGSGAPSARAERMWRVAAAVALVAAGAGGFALVAPRISAPSSTETAELRPLIQRLAEAMEGRRVERTAAAPDATPALERIEPLEPVVARAEPGGEGRVPERAPEVWEQRGDQRILRDALPDHDAYRHERMWLALEERSREMQESRVATSDRSTKAAPAVVSPLATFFGELRVASSNYPAYEHVQVWPIELAASRSKDSVPVLGCEKAIAEDVLAVTEGSVSESVLAVNSDLRRPVLVLAGDVLAGGRQDRVAREDVLIAPGQKLSIPVYTCGRSQRTSYTRFRHSDGLAMPEIRAIVAADRAILGGTVGQDQFDDAVGRTLRSLVTTGGTRGSLDDLFRNPELGTQMGPTVNSFLKRLEGPAVVGFAVSVGSQILGVEVFGDHATMMEHRLRVLRSYVMSVIAIDRPEGTPPSRETVAMVVSAAAAGAFHAETPTGSGTLSVFRGVDHGPFGFGLLDGTRVVHAVLFTSIPRSVDPAAARAGRRTAGDTAPLEGGPDASAPGRGDSGGGEGVEPR